MTQTDLEPSERTPSEAWGALRAGNARFVSGTVEHPRQGVDRRTEVTSAQHPFVVLFGCSDSRVPAEIIFDRGLGDMFVVRTAGHVADTSVLGSIEYAISVLGVPLVVVLGHDRCGAVAAARNALVSGAMPPGMIRAVVERVIPGIVTRAAAHAHSADDGFDLEVAEPGELVREHVRSTVQMLSSSSAVLAEAIEDGRCGIVGAEYTLADGQVNVVETVGAIG